VSATTPPNDPNNAIKLGFQLEQIVTKRIADDKLVLPSMPAIAAKCLELLRNPEVEAKAAANLIEKDPVLAAQLLRLANSALLGTREPITKVLGAVTRVGTMRLRQFILETTARKTFESRDVLINACLRKIWEHSVAVATLTGDVVALANAGDPETGYLAGLLHDIGKPIVAAMLLEAERTILGLKPSSGWIGSIEWLGVIQRTHRKIGVALSQKWGLADSVCRAIKDCEEYDSSDRLCEANAVRFANAVAKQNGLYECETNKDDNDALIMIGQSLLGLDPKRLPHLIASAQTAVANLRS
jgi:putative nucleotidyltransferase with HDIG domain